MSQAVPERVSNQSFIDRKLAGARYQIDTLRNLTANQSRATGKDKDTAAESCACAGVEQILQAVAATLQSLNLQLPEPLPASRVSLRNLRDEFQSVQVESAVLQSFEQVERPGGWLDQLEQQQLGSTFQPLLRHKDGSYQILRDPLEPDAGVEAQAPADYLAQALQHAEELVQRVSQELPDDVVHFREGHRKQTRRLI